MALDLPPPDKQARRPGHEAERGTIALIQLLPNLMTLTAICFGMASIRFAFQGEFVTAVVLILAAGVLDGLDGRVARYLRSESLIGAELDSLADFLNFGVAPALLVYAHSLHDGSELGWIVVLAYAMACVLRLARFNVTSASANPPLPKGQFQGVPSPAGAGLALAPLYFSFLTGQVASDWVVAPYLLMVGGLMIARMPTPSLKSVRLPRTWAGATLVLAAGMGLLLWLWPWATLLAICAAYLAMLGFSALQRGLSRR